MIEPIMKEVESFTVTGFSARTQNSDEFHEETAKLPKLWQQFYGSTRSPNTTIFGIYSDYEFDANGPYTVTVGVTNEKQRSGLSTVKINSGHYLVFRSKGSMPLIVVETWKRVWDYFRAGCPYQRCFMTDFEAYSNSDDLAIYIGVK